MKSTNHNAVWKLFGSEYDQAVADRDHFQVRMERRLGHDLASEIQWHVDIALGRIESEDEPNPKVMVMRDFYELLALELAIEEIENRVERMVKHAFP